MICTVAAIFGVNLDLDLFKCPRDRDGMVVACVVDDDDKIDNPLRHHFIVGALQSAGGVVSGHYHHNFLAVQHRRTRRLINVILSEAKNLGLLSSILLAIHRDVSLRST